MHRTLPKVESPSHKCDGQRPLFVGVDVGGTNIRVGLVDADGRTLACDSMRTESEWGPESACQRIGQLARHLVADTGASFDDVARVGLATPGMSDPATGILLSPGNLPGWWNFPIRVRASHHLGRPVTLSNDANAAAYGEYWCGAGSGFQSLILLTLGTGIGAGIIVGGKLMQGSHNCASECGYIVIDQNDNARSDALGRRGTLEAYASAQAVIERALEALDGGESSTPGRSLGSWRADHAAGHRRGGRTRRPSREPSRHGDRKLPGSRHRDADSHD